MEMTTHLNQIEEVTPEKLEEEVSVPDVTRFEQPAIATMGLAGPHVDLRLQKKR